METIGYQLRTARARKNCTLEQAAQATKIRADQLAALEADDFGKISAPIYAKAFLKNYADYLGLDGRALAEQLTQKQGEIERQLPMVQPEADSAEALLHPPRVNWAAVVTGILAIAVVAAALIWLWRHYGQTHDGSQPPGVATGVATRDFYVQPSFANETIPLPSSSGITLNHTLTLRALQPTPVQVLADGAKVFDDVLKPGAGKDFTAKTQFRLVVQNAGALTLALDGNRLPKLGAKGERVEKELIVGPAAARRTD